MWQIGDAPMVEWAFRNDTLRAPVHDSRAGILLDTVVVRVSAGTRDIEILSPDGARRASGRFGRAWGLGRYRGDSIWVMESPDQDSGDGAVVSIVHGVEGDARTLRLPTDRAWSTPVALWDGHWATFVEREDVPADATAGLTTALPGQLAFWDAEGTRVTEDRLLPMGSRVRRDNGRLIPGPVSPRATIAGAGRDVYWFWPRSASYLRIGIPGVAEQHVAWQRHGRPVEQALRDSILHLVLRRGSAREGPASAEEERLSRQEERLPEYGTGPLARPLVDACGAVWLPEYTLPGLEPARRWLIFSRDGQVIGRALVPSGFVLLDVRADRVLGALLRERWDEHIQIRALDRTSECEPSS